MNPMSSQNNIPGTGQVQEWDQFSVYGKTTNIPQSGQISIPGVGASLMSNVPQSGRINKGGSAMGGGGRPNIPSSGKIIK